METNSRNNDFIFYHFVLVNCRKVVIFRLMILYKAGAVFMAVVNIMLSL